jgi:protein gp37
VQRTKIDWGIPGLLTWNPITGCRRGCSYCYARRIHNRFNKEPFSKITLHTDRLHEPQEKKKSKTIFVGSMTDIEYWETEQKELVVAVCRANKQHTFIFLSKNPNAYNEIDWPDNTMQGLTLTKCDTSGEYHNLYHITLFPRPFISIEPLLGMFSAPVPPGIEKVIVGAQTGMRVRPPEKAWIESVKENIFDERSLFWKPSIRKYL